MFQLSSRCCQHDKLYSEWPTTRWGPDTCGHEKPTSQSPYRMPLTMMQVDPMIKQIVPPATLSLGAKANHVVSRIHVMPSKSPSLRRPRIMKGRSSSSPMPSFKWPTWWTKTEESLSLSHKPTQNAPPNPKKQCTARAVPGWAQLPSTTEKGTFWSKLPRLAWAKLGLDILQTGGPWPRFSDHSPWWSPNPQLSSQPTLIHVLGPRLSRDHAQPASRRKKPTK